MNTIPCISASWESFIASEEACYEAACTECAISNGFTPEQAELCDDGDVGCLDCPFKAEV